MSTRNRLYDIVSTLLQQNSHVERCLLWILALTRGGVSGNFQESSSPYSMKVNLLGELAGHTRKDLIEALEFVSKEPSKRGLLASLLKSQINKQAMPLSRTI